MPWIDTPTPPGAQRAARVTARAGSGRGWYEIRNAAADEAELMIYDEVGGWFGATAEEFIAELRAITAPNLRVRINSPGGSVFEGIAIANALRAHPGNVTMQVDGIAASIASVIAMAGNRLVMMPNSMLMIHNASGMCYGDAAEMAKMAEVLDLISMNLADVYATKTGGTRDEWRAAMQTESWYLPVDAVEAGLADEAVPGQAPADPQMSAAAWDLAAYGYTGPAPAQQPKPGPPPAAKTDEPAAPTLTINVADLLDDDTIARLRAAVTMPVSVEPVAAGPAETPAASPEPAPAAPELAAPTLQDRPGPEVLALSADAPTVPEPEPEPGWDEIVARLTAPTPDPWAAATSHLTTSPASSSATES